MDTVYNYNRYKGYKQWVLFNIKVVAIAQYSVDF